MRQKKPLSWPVILVSCLLAGGIVAGIGGIPLVLTGCDSASSPRRAASPEAMPRQEELPRQAEREAGPPLPKQLADTGRASSVAVTRAVANGTLGGRGGGRARLAVAGDASDDALSFNYNAQQQEAYDRLDENLFRAVAHDPLSTFSVDVDSASYAILRRFLSEGKAPPKDAVRIEEMVNYFPYDYAPPTDGRPFAVHVETTSAPWTPAHRLVRIGIKGREIREEQRPACNLVFLIDTSGSMQQENRLPLVKRALGDLVRKLNDRDTVTIVTYAGSAGMALEPTRGSDRDRILASLERLEAGGSTNGAAGIELAYQQARSHFIDGGANRVLICTDGDFNVGITDRGSLTRVIEEKARTGVYLSVLGFGMGNYKDATLEELSRRGNGNYAYIDTLSEARKVLVEQASGTLITIAKDVKIQVEFNPAKVAGYRLIGYENRLLQNRDFNDDKKDAGDIGAGHTVTALYEVVPAGLPIPDGGTVDPLKYQTPPGGVRPAPGLPAFGGQGELLTVKLRYKAPDAQAVDGTSSLIEVPVLDSGKSFETATADTRFAAAVAEYGMLLRDSRFKGNSSLAHVVATAAAARQFDPGEHRAKFADLLTGFDIRQSNLRGPGPALTANP